MPRPKKETTLSKQLINDLRYDCSQRHEFIKLVKIHGTRFQEKMVDYIGCYKGHFIAIEFKTEGGKETPQQEAFLESIARTEGVALTIVFLINRKVVIFFRYVNTSQEVKTYIATNKLISLYEVIRTIIYNPSSLTHPLIDPDNQHQS